MCQSENTEKRTSCDSDAENSGSTKTPTVNTPDAQVGSYDVEKQEHSVGETDSLGKKRKLCRDMNAFGTLAIALIIFAVLGFVYVIAATVAYSTTPVLTKDTSTDTTVPAWTSTHVPSDAGVFDVSTPEKMPITADSTLFTSYGVTESPLDALKPTTRKHIPMSWLRGSLRSQPVA